MEARWVRDDEEVPSDGADDENDGDESDDK